MAFRDDRIRKDSNRDPPAYFDDVIEGAAGRRKTAKCGGFTAVRSRKTNGVRGRLFRIFSVRAVCAGQLPA